MDKNECFEKVRKIIADHFKIDIEEVQLTSKFVEDFGVNFIDEFPLVWNLEENFKIQIPPYVAARKVKTVENVVEGICSAKIPIISISIFEMPFDRKIPIFNFPEIDSARSNTNPPRQNSNNIQKKENKKITKQRILKKIHQKKISKDKRKTKIVEEAVTHKVVEKN